MNRLTQPNLEPVPGFGTDSRAIKDACLRHPGRDSDCATATHDCIDSLLSQLRAVVLLGGAVGRSEFQSALGRSIVDLPLGSGQSVLAHWCEQCVTLRQFTGADKISVRLTVDQSALLPAFSPPKNAIELIVERDPFEFRGTGGLLRDIAQSYDDDDYLLVANAFQLLTSPLQHLAADLASRSASVAVVSHADGTPSGVMLVRCRSLREIPKIGFVDMKEQGLGIISREHSVKVLERARPTGLPIRTHVSYLAALRQISRAHGQHSSSGAEDWESDFSIVEDGADVSSAATIHNSVVLRGAKVEKGAVVINSVVCGGGVVRRGQIVTDDLVKAVGRR